MNDVRPVLNAKHYAIITAAFLLFVIYGSFVPLQTRQLSWDQAAERYSKAMSRGVQLESRSDFAANVILFVPLGFLAGGMVSVDRRRPIALLALIPAMAFLSAAIEFGQLWFPDRNTNINDIAAETLGGIVGLAGWWFFGQEFTDRARSAWEKLGPGDWAAKALPAYVLLLVIIHGMPFDLTLSPYQLKQKYKAGLEIDAAASNAATIAIAPYRHRVFEKTLQNIAYFLPIGALIAQLPGWRWRMRESAGRVLFIGLATAAGIEAVQLIVMSAGTYASDVLSGGLLVLAGWWLAIQSRPIPRTTWLIATVMWGIALAACYWQPWEFAAERFQERFDKAEWMPFADYYAGNYISAFNRMIDKTVVFAPLGFAFGRFLYKPEISDGFNPSLALQALGLGAIVSAIVEVGQPLFGDHRASISDVILGGLGAFAGAIIAGRIGRFQPPSDPVPASERFFVYGQR